MKKQWLLQTKRADFAAISEKYGISPVTARCMVNRGICSEEDIEEFMNGTLEQLSSPWLMKDMDQAVELILAGRKQGAAIASDFDCDGIFSAFILKKGFEECGIRAEIFTPDRVKEGYGLNRRIVDEAVKKKVGFLITCDNGIAAKEEILYAKEKGLTVIVTDHHEVQGEPPAADAVIDPKQEDCTYPFRELCGAGVAFQLIGALYERAGIPAERREELLVYAGFATVADLMELRGENRILVREGLARMKTTDNKGLRALMEVQGLAGGKITAYHIGFVLGPCFNAAGRIDTVARAFRLLREEDAGRAHTLAAELKEINDTRKQMTEEAAGQAYSLMEQSGKERNPVHVLLLPDCHESLVGLVASRIKERYNHPVIVFTRVGDGRVKGSGRSIESYHMFDHLMECRDLMIHFGGHRMAAGMTLLEKDLPELERRLNENSGLTEEDFVPAVRIDVPLPVGRLTEELVRDLEKLEPFGAGNPKPIFAEQHFKILWAKKRGRDWKVLALRVANEAGSVIQAVYFGDVGEFDRLVCEEWGEDELRRVYAGKENAVDLGLAYYPSVNEYRGNRSIEIVIKDFCRIRREK